MRAISVFTFEAGTSTFGWRAAIALRTRVNMSAMGSLVIVLLLQYLPDRLPTRLCHAGDLAVQRKLAEAQPADAELAQERARTSAAPAAVAVAAPQLRRLRLPLLFQLDVFCNLRSRGHLLFLYCRNGIPIWRNSARPSASVLAVVV